MGASQPTGSGGNQSSVPKKNRFGTSDDVNRSIAERADKYAQEKLGITTTIANPNEKAIKGNVTGYMAMNTGGNQMYGTMVQEARGEYLEKQGLATGRTVNYGPIDPATGKGRFSYTAYDSGTVKDGKLTFTSQGRDVMQRVRDKDIPLSKEMFESQKNFQLGLAALTGIMGVPLLPTTLANQALGTSYTDYVQRREGGFYNKAGIVGKFLPSNNQNQQTQNQRQDEMSNTQMVNEDRKKKIAGLGASTTTQGRTFFA
jgi:hypothetical protein|tara:strand:- start:11730 stop:12503 length:774 start_codon:yes stop_codon:yes gene_type:complete